MKHALFTITILSLLYGILILLVAKSAIHEIQAYLLFLIAIVSLSGGGIIHTLQQSKTK